MIFTSPFPRIEIPNETFHDNVLKTYDNLENVEAIIDFDSESSYSFDQIKQLARYFGSGLFQQGLNHGDVVLIYLPNCIDYPVIVLGVMSIGGVICTANNNYTLAELSHQINDAKPTFIICVPENYQTALEAKRMHRQSLKIIVLGNGNFENTFKYYDLIKNNGSVFPTNIKWDVKNDLAAIFYSSGTSGLPKGVMLTHFNLVACLEGYRFLMTFLPSKELIKNYSLVILPMFHIAGFLGGISLNSVVKTSVVIFSPYTFQKFLQAIEKYKPDTLTVPPAVLLKIVKSPLTDYHDLSSVKFVRSGASQLSVGLEEAIKRRLNLTFVKQAYGLTETAGIGTYVSPEDNKPGNSGYPSPNIDLMVKDISTGKSLGPNQKGEICLRGPSIMKSYLNNPIATAECLDDQGWLSTGDIGYVDESGLLYIEDRIKELIKYKGYQIAPAELESILLKHPQIDDVAVIGIPVGDLGELPKAYIVRKNQNLSKKEILDVFEKQVAPHKYLRGGIEFIKEIPRNNAGKMLRRVLKEMEIKRNRSRL